MLSSASRTTVGVCVHCGQHVRLVVEGEDEEFVLVIELLEQETIDRGARVGDAAAEHAVADVEQDAEADGHALAGELRERLLLAVLVDLEVVASEVADEMAVGVAHRHRDAGDVDARCGTSSVDLS